MNINEGLETIRFEIKDGIAYLEINRPDKLNALNEQVLRELKGLLTKLRAVSLSEVKGVLLSGAGDKAFIAGADIKSMSGMTTSEAQDFGELGQAVTLLFEQLPFPVIALVHGFALGGGCEMAMSADFILATKSAVFGQPEVKLGLIPGFGGTQRLARLVGRNVAKEIIYTGRNLKAEEALERGLVLELFDTKEELLNRGEELLNKISTNSPVAIKLAKQVMNDGNDLTVKDGLNKELDQFSAIFSSEDMKEGTTAFLEKRRANFVGR